MTTTGELKNTDQELVTLCYECLTVKDHGLLTDQVIPAKTASLQQPTNWVLYADGLLHTLIIWVI